MSSPSPSPSPSPSASAPESIEAYLRLGLTVAHEAGRTLARTWHLHPNDRASYVTKSSTADVVTETDQECERIVLGGIRRVYPHHRFIGEESHTSEGMYQVATGAETVTWIVDPIDGTNNFVHALPEVAVSVGVMRGQEVVVGIVHLPIARETYYATRGGGAWLVSVSPTTGEIEHTTAVRLRVSRITELQRACVATEMGYSRSAALLELMQLKTGALLAGGLQSLRMSGSCCVDMIRVAAGKLDAYYEGISTTVGPKPWDVTAASLIVTEAGGVIQDITGAPFSIWSGRVLVAANNEIATIVAQAINRTTQEWAARHPDMADATAYKPGAGIAPENKLSANL